MLTIFFVWLLALPQAPAKTPQASPLPSDIAQAAPAQSQPCDGAKTQVELNECFSKLYESADAQLNLEYNRVVNALKKNLTQAQHDNATALIAHNQTALAKLLAAQRAWLAYRDANCDSVKFQYEGGSIQPMVWSQCMADTTQQRITTLRSAYDLAN